MAAQSRGEKPAIIEGVVCNELYKRVNQDNSVYSGAVSNVVLALIHVSGTFK